MSENPELEQAIISSPDEPAAYLVYADWLQSHGDPRGELIMLQHRGLDDEAKAFIVEHADYLLGQFATQKPETFELVWQLGFIKSATIGWEAFGSDDDEAGTCQEQLTAFLRLPVARFVQELVLGPSPGEEEMSLGTLAAAIDEVPQPCLRTLYLGDTSDWDISGTSTAMPNSHAIPNIRKITLRGGSVTIGEVDLPELRELTIESGSLVVQDLGEICNARVPKLERLEIWFGDPNYGASGHVENIAKLLAADGFASVKHLGLQNCPFGDAVATALITSKILPQLESLDLSMGNLSDFGVAAMLASKDAFAHLTTLNLEDNALTNASWPAARALAKQVVFGTDHTPERAVPRDDRNRYRRFVSVGE